MARGLTLDAGVLIAAERNDEKAWLLRRLRAEAGVPLAIPTPALAQAWRGPRSARLARFLEDCDIIYLDEDLAKRAGSLCGKRNTKDVVDASVVVTAELIGADIVTTDPDDLRTLATRRRVRVIDLRTL